MIDDAEPADDADPAASGGQGRGEGDAKPKASRVRRRKIASGGEVRGRKIHLSDELHDRLWLYSRQKRITVSAAASELLEKVLPRFRVEREG